MREIKFRAWVQPEAKTLYQYKRQMLHDFLDINLSELVDINDSSEILVMQYTGLKDVNDKEIYEGDLIHLYGYGQYQAEYPFIELFEAAAEKDIGSILGNIHENPELLELAA
jgi:uncharacterized phage protein (TIGR01671 family)